MKDNSIVWWVMAWLLFCTLIIAALAVGYTLGHPQVEAPIDQAAIADANAQQLYPGLIRVIDRGAGVVVYIFDRGTNRAALAIIPISFTRIEYPLPEANP